MDFKVVLCSRKAVPVRIGACRGDDGKIPATRRSALLAILASGGVALPRKGIAWAEAESDVAIFKGLIAKGEKSGGGIIVPDFDSGLDWMNVGRPLSLEKDLRGRVVLLDFWTYCCINCMHILPDLEYLEKKFENDPFTVVGVHSAKFDNEKDTMAIRQAVLRYGIQHPVINDSSMTMWRALGVSSWPTLAVISPEGKLLTMLPGEGNRRDLEGIISAALEYYGEKGLLRRQPLPIALEKGKQSQMIESALRFPGKIAIDIEGNRLLISDSSNHRLLVTDLDGNFVSQIGRGTPGFSDGPISEAQFNRPQGIAYDKSLKRLYVADTENHALRQVDLVSGEVRTLAGNGSKGRDYAGGSGGTSQLLNSPWDVTIDGNGDKLLLAMAGLHQIWTFDLKSQVAQAFSGNGYERNNNAPTGKLSSWAQPSGIALSADQTVLYVADSESSSIRQMDLISGGSKLLAGGDPLYSENLFRFGDVDGSLETVLLQHPLGLCVSGDPNVVYVADSYNHKIKLLDLSKQTVETLAGTGIAGFKDGDAQDAQFSEPAGIAIGPNKTLFIADTNNNSIRLLDLNLGKVKTLNLESVPQASVGDQTMTADAKATGPPPGARVVTMPPIHSPTGEIRLMIACPTGYHYTKGAKSVFQVQTDPVNAAFRASPQTGELREGKESKIKFKLDGEVQEGSLVRINAKVYYCQEGDVCLFDQVSFEIPLVPDASGATSEPIKLQYTTQPRKQRNKSALIF